MKKSLLRNPKIKFNKKSMFGRKKESSSKKSSKSPGDMKSSSISPSVDEFDNMMDKVKGDKKKGFFGKKK